MYLQHMIRSMLKQLQLGETDQTLLTFIDKAMKVEERKKLLESHYSQELSLLYILQEDYDRAKYYTNYAMQLFMQVGCYSFLLQKQHKKFLRNSIMCMYLEFIHRKYWKWQCIQCLCLLQNYSSVDTLLTQSRLTILQSVQALTEIQDFLLFIREEGEQMLPFLKLKKL